MVRITDYVLKENQEGTEFFGLILNGGPEVVKSKETGRSYITVRKVTVPCTFDEAMCKSLIGSSLPGRIIKVETDEPYDYETPDGEVIQLSHRWEFVNDPTPEDAVFQGEEVVQPINEGRS